LLSKEKTMKKGLRHAFNCASLTLGGSGLLLFGLGSALGGWSTDSMDLTGPALFMTALSAALFYAGYKSTLNTNNDNKPNPPEQPPSSPGP
jgi:hypothetical protein